MISPVAGLIEMILPLFGPLTTVTLPGTSVPSLSLSLSNTWIGAVAIFSSVVAVSFPATGGLLVGVGGGDVGGGEVGGDGGGAVAVGGGGDVAVGDGGKVAVGGEVLVGGTVAVGCNVLVGRTVAVGSTEVDEGCGVPVVPPEGEAGVGPLVEESSSPVVTEVGVLEAVGIGIFVDVAANVGCGMGVVVGVGVGGKRLIVTGLLPSAPAGVMSNRALSVAA